MKVNNEYRKFLKQSKAYRFGDYFPDLTVKDYLGNESTIYSLITDYLLIFVYSVSCESCIKGLEALSSFIRTQYKQTRIVILIDLDDETIVEMRKEFPESINIFCFSKYRIKKELFVNGLPIGFGINCFGQIVSNYHCSNIHWINQLAKPFYKFLEKREESDICQTF